MGWGMSATDPHSAACSVRLGWRDVLASGRIAARSLVSPTPHLHFTAMARVSAIDVRDLPQQRVFTASDGARLTYRSYGDEQSLLRLLLIHGSACFADQLHHLAQAVASAGLARVHTLDMRGHGGSDPVGSDPGCFLSDSLEFLGAMQASAPHAKLVVGGHSAGGGLVLRIAEHVAADLVSGWLFLAPFLGLTSRTMRPNFGGWVSGVDYPAYSAAMSANLLGSHRWDNRPLIRFNEEAYLHDPRFAREWDLTTIIGFGPRASGPGRDPIVRGPALLVAGTGDECFEPSHYESEFTHLAPDGQCRILPGLGHWDILADPVAVGACKGWLEDLRPQAPIGVKVVEPKSAPLRQVG